MTVFTPNLAAAAAPRTHTLKSGVRVVCDPMPGLESLALSVVIDAGARWESPAEAGWAHLLEHMVFKGAGSRSAKALVEDIEGQGGHINAATGQERTSFQVRCLKAGLPLAMEILSDLVLRPRLSAEDLQKEKAVIAQEIAEAADAPDDRVFDLAQSQAFAGQSLGRPILGEVASLEPATPESLGVFHQALYDPSRIIVSAAGAVEEDSLLALAEAAFGDAAAPARRLSRGACGVFAGGAAKEQRRLEQAHLVLLAPAFSRHDPEFFALSLFTEILGGGMSSRLFQEARERRGLAYAIDAYPDSYEDVGVLGVYAGTAAENARPAAQLVAGEILKLAEDVSDAELSRAKAQMKGGLFMRREAPLARAEAHANNLHSFGRIFEVAELAQQIDAVDVEGVQGVARTIAGRGRAASAVLGPKAALAAGAAFAEALAAG